MSTETVEFLEVGTGTIVARTSRRGNLHTLKFDTTLPLLRSICPQMPFQDSPDKTYCTLPYTAATSVLWAAFCNENASAVDRDKISANLLNDDAMTRVCRKLKDLGIRLDSFQSETVAAEALAAFVAKHPRELAFKLEPGDLVKISPARDAPGAKAPEELSYYEDYAFGNIKQASGSYIRMGTLEMILAPRILLPERYDPDGQCMQALETLQQVVATHVTALKPKVDAWLVVKATGEAAVAAAALARAQAPAGTPVPAAVVMPAMPSSLKSRLMRSTSTLINSFGCTMSLVAYDYTDLENFDFHREDMLTDIIEYEYGAPDRKTSLIAKHFLPYASVYPNIFKIVQQADSSPSAFAIAEDVKQVVCPQASWDTGMALLDRALKDFIPELSMDLHKVKSASDKGALVITSATTGATRDTGDMHMAGTGGGDSRRQATTEIREFAKTAPVLQLALTIAPYLLTTPVQHTKAIVKAHRSKLPLIQQLMLAGNARKELPGAPKEIGRLRDLRGYTTTAMAYSICCEDDPVRGMVVPVDLEDFVEDKFPDAAANALWTMDFNNAKHNFHKILYMMDSSVQGGQAQDRTPEAAVLYGVFEANERIKDVGDNVCYAIGYRNGAYSAFLDPLQKVLLKQQGSSADDERDVQEAISEVARMGHDEMRKYREVIMHTNSPQEPFPFDGDNLVDPNGQHLKRITKIKEQIQTGDLRLFKRRKEKQEKLLEYAGSLASPCTHTHITPCPYRTHT